ncbi:hypothetical protein HBH64_097880 [Parastagonospora nodorum]|nr:hypothetical protein HBH52_123670 [Parastagonospora nodorum]KAH4285059.1 hypothetical protein HBI02_236310 [Parastagonospora nodorum]KAH4300241.1 hypothetical protein HBI01_108990 [Parastagonospora nodorum]KAH4327484.1 hypothetical protein HBI00_121060 [Parastagonospora nodorum]KAH4370095.1 hypothetical protein HBH94_121280 [Parastagonospora nodorum]
MRHARLLTRIQTQHECLESSHCRVRGKWRYARPLCCKGVGMIQSPLPLRYNAPVYRGKAAADANCITQGPSNERHCYTLQCDVCR